MIWLHILKSQYLQVMLLALRALFQGISLLEKLLLLVEVKTRRRGCSPVQACLGTVDIHFSDETFSSYIGGVGGFSKTRLIKMFIFWASIMEKEGFVLLTVTTGSAASNIGDCSYHPNLGTRVQRNFLAKQKQTLSQENFHCRWSLCDGIRGSRWFLMISALEIRS